MRVFVRQGVRDEAGVGLSEGKRSGWERRIMELDDG